jgi:Sulfotransferase family
MQDKAGLGHPSAVPVFIIGMPRSGTTLIEQILASHARVFGAGEIGDLTDTVGQLITPGRTSAEFPEGVRDMRLLRFQASQLPPVCSHVAAKDPPAAPYALSIPSHPLRSIFASGI